VTRALPAHRQQDHRIRLEWGPAGAAAIGSDADVAVVVDVLSFTTTVTVAVARGIAVHPFRWRDERAAAYAAEHDAVLAVGRSEARGRPGAVSLSPVSVAQATGVERLVLPSPNGSAISAELAGSGATVVAGCLRNAGAVATWLRPRLQGGEVVAVVPAGERWPDGSLRPAAEDLWGAGAVLRHLDRRLMSPEARLGYEAYAAVAGRLADAVAGCASGRELVERGFGQDVEIAVQSEASPTVPVLRDGAFA
jgi:2-phosphosulfolactate phosphatase